MEASLCLTLTLDHFHLLPVFEGATVGSKLNIESLKEKKFRGLSLASRESW